MNELNRIEPGKGPAWGADVQRAILRWIQQAERPLGGDARGDVGGQVVAVLDDPCGVTMFVLYDAALTHELSFVRVLRHRRAARDAVRRLREEAGTGCPALERVTWPGRRVEDQPVSALYVGAARLPGVELAAAGRVEELTATADGVVLAVRMMDCGDLQVVPCAS